MEPTIPGKLPKHNYYNQLLHLKVHSEHCDNCKNKNCKEPINYMEPLYFSSEAQEEVYERAFIYTLAAIRRHARQEEKEIKEKPKEVPIVNDLFFDSESSETTRSLYEEKCKKKDFEKIIANEEHYSEDNDIEEDDIDIEKDDIFMVLAILQQYIEEYYDTPNTNMEFCVFVKYCLQDDNHFAEVLQSKKDTFEQEGYKLTNQEEYAHKFLKEKCKFS